MSEGGARPDGSDRSRFWSRLAGGLAGLAVLGTVFAYLVLGRDKDDSDAGGQAAVALGVLDPARPEVGKPAPDFALVDTRDGTTVRKLSDYRGKTVVLNWYASWRGPCAAEIPDFQEAYAALDGEIVVLAVNLQESRETASSMLERLGATFPSVLDTDGAVAQHYRLLGMPTTYFIDKDGIVRLSGAGAISADFLREELAKLGHEY